MMNSKAMEVWSKIHFYLALIAFVYMLVVDKYSLGILFFLVISIIFSVGSSIMKKLESLTNKE
jgi:hypothetical protein